jgi:serine/threonine protein kinase
MGIVMELAEGGSLADFEYVDLKEVLIMTTQISNAMEYMHSQGVVHRDIKPDNILLSHTGAGAIQIKIADFGVAVLLATTSGSTALLSRAGTHQYFAPERAKGQSYGKMADMWSVGCVIIELLTPERLRDAIWDDGVEVSGRREQLIGHVEREDEGLGGIVRELLHLDKNFRLSAWSLKSNLYTRAAAEARTDTVIV